MARHDTKTQMVFDYLVGFLDKNKFSSTNKLPSELFLSRELAVSRYTVRSALEILQKDGFIYKIQGAGAFFNKDKILDKDSYKIIKTDIDKLKIALILQGQDTLANADLKKGVESIFSKEEVNLRVYITDNKFANERKCIQTLMYEGFDGFIVDGVKAFLLNPNLGLYKECYDRLHIPVIFYNNYYRELNYPKVLTDGRAAGNAITSLLIKNGHKKIGGIFVCDNYQAVEKFHGMYEALQNSGINLVDKYLKWCVSDDAHDVSFKKTIENYLSKIPNATAILCCNSIIYKLVKQVLKSQGRKIPDDISLVALDMSLEDLKKDTVTCTTNQGFVIGQKVAKNLLQMIKNKDFKDKELEYSCLLEPQLHIAKSIKKLGS